jgi:hypothetical protein
MIKPDILALVRNGTCAVGYLTVPLEEHMKDPRRPFFKVVGTGFLVRPTSVITNRHVIEALDKDQADLGFPDKQRMIMFVAPGQQTVLNVTVRMIQGLGIHPDLDVGFVDFQREPESQLVGIESLKIHHQWDMEVSEPIGVCGYPYGHFMLQRDGRVYRWGPVVQQGYVSAVSPFDTSAIPDEVLLDIRIAEGMSGAPIFRPQDGRAVGIVHSAWQATTALGLPLTESTVNAWLSAYDSRKTQPISF